jgi:hypothetical protein
LKLTTKWRVDVDIELFYDLEVILLVLVFNNHLSIFSMSCTEPDKDFLPYVMNVVGYTWKGIPVTVILTGTIIHSTDFHR